MPAVQQNITEVLQTGLSLPTRSILIADEINDYTIKQVWTGIQALDNGEPFAVYISSGGGIVNSGWAVYDMLRACKSHVTTVGMGRVYSMATTILQAGDERILRPNCTVMIHPLYLEGIGETALDEINTELTAAKKNNDRMLRLLGRSMGLTLPKLIQKYPKTTYLTAAEAVAVKLADSIRR